MHKEENEQLTRVGPGTPGGEMLRRYWWPIQASDHVRQSPLPVRLLGENFVLFRDGEGKAGLLARQCAHRGSSLEFGRVEKHGIRCCYHGWVFDVNGKCIEQPAEPPGSTLKDMVRQRAYALREEGGLVFAYIGPDPVPLFPKIDMLFQTDRRRRVWGRDVHTNWLQQSENIVDPYHIMVLHGVIYPEIALVRPEVSWTETPEGIAVQCEYPGGQRDRHHLVFPSAIRVNVHRVGQEPSQYLIYNVPVDDTHSVAWWMWASDSIAPPYIVTAEPYQKTVPGSYRRVEDGWFNLSNEAQDDAAIGSQGLIADRTSEFLGASDLGIIRYRRLLKNAIDAVREGLDPQAVLREGHPGVDRIQHFDARKTGFGSKPGEIRDPEHGAKLGVVAPYERHKLYESGTTA